MKEYELKNINKPKDNTYVKFYKKLALCFVFFLTVVTFCRLSPDIKHHVRSVLYSSCDVKVIEERVNKYTDKFKDICNKIESYIALEE